MKVLMQIIIDEDDLKRERVNREELLDNIIDLIGAYCHRRHLSYEAGYNPELIVSEITN